MINKFYINYSEDGKEVEVIAEDHRGKFENLLYISDYTSFADVAQELYDMLAMCANAPIEMKDLDV